jgi:hypothetical protein
MRSSGRARTLWGWPEFEPVLEEQQITLSRATVCDLQRGVTICAAQVATFGRDRLKRLVSTIRLYDAERIAKSIYNGVQQHRDHTEAFDDFTLVVIRAE